MMSLPDLPAFTGLPCFSNNKESAGTNGKLSYCFGITFMMESFITILFQVPANFWGQNI